jgi:Tfp pilus assembly protein PilX
VIARRRQEGYLLFTVIATLFLVATVAVLLAHDSSMSANTANRELETARVDYLARAGLQHALWRGQNSACMGNVTIPDTALGADTYNASIQGAASGTLVTVPADQDAWIRSDDVSRNNGTTTWNHVRNEVAGTEQVLTRFDLSSLAAKAQISSAVAWFHIKALKPHPEGSITIHEITADWAETAVTWESFAGAYRSSAIGMIPAQDTGDVWVAVNLTAQVQAWVNGQPNYGILFDPKADGTHTEYTAREDGSNPPRLEVVIGSGGQGPTRQRRRPNTERQDCSRLPAAGHHEPAAWHGSGCRCDARLLLSTQLRRAKLRPGK